MYLPRASMQTAGRGTHGRAWDSPDGAGLYLTRYARHEEPLSPDGLTPTVGVALAEAIRAATGVLVREAHQRFCVMGSNSAGFLVKARELRMACSHPSLALG